VKKKKAVKDLSSTASHIKQGRKIARCRSLPLGISIINVIIIIIIIITNIHQHQQQTITTTTIIQKQ